MEEWMPIGGARSAARREQWFHGGKAVCDECVEYIPVLEQVAETGGARVGALCCKELGIGDKTDRKRMRAEAAELAAAWSVQEIGMRPPVARDGISYAGVDILDESASVTGVAPFPVILNRGGAPVSVVLSGVLFVAADVFSYGNAGITDAAPPVLVSAQEWDLSVQAGALMPVGKYPLIYNGTPWQGVFDVR